MSSPQGNRFQSVETRPKPSNAAVALANNGVLFKALVTSLAMPELVSTVCGTATPGGTPIRARGQSGHMGSMGEPDGGEGQSPIAFTPRGAGELAARLEKGGAVGPMANQTLRGATGEPAQSIREGGVLGPMAYGFKPTSISWSEINSAGWWTRSATSQTKRTVQTTPGSMKTRPWPLSKKK